MACGGLAAAIVGSPLAPRLAPPGLAGFAPSTCSQGDNLRVAPVVNQPRSDGGARSWTARPWSAEGLHGSRLPASHVGLRVLQPAGLR